MRLRWLAIPLLVPFAPVPQAADTELFNAAGLRAKHYRAPPPQTVPGAEKVDTTQVLRMMAERNAVLIDVLGLTKRPETKSLGAAWLPTKRRYSLPGATWLPNVGYGTLSTEMDTYFRRELSRLTNNDKTRTLIIFCVEDCWMSWNAVQRATGYGYSNAYWYRGGTDAWETYGGHTVEVIPVPLQDGAYPAGISSSAQE